MCPTVWLQSRGEKMSWLILAIAARFFWACSNILDQYMVRFSGHQSMIALFITQHLFVLPFIIGLGIYIGWPIPIHLASLVWIGVGVAAYLGALYPYFTALKKDDAHHAIPFMELIPIFLTIMSYLVFGDKLVGNQLIGAAIVIVSGFLFSWNFKTRKIRLRAVLLMAAAAFGYAVYQLSLRYGAAAEPVWSVAFFVYCGFFLSGMTMFIAASRPRRLFFQSIRASHGKIAAVAITQNLADMAASISLVTAFAKAPGAGYVAALNGTQPIWVLLISTVVGLFLPKYFPRLVWDREMKIKCLLLLIMAGGIGLLTAS
jgi:drug/metabolite transporter (DMT)-like permease